MNDIAIELEAADTLLDSGVPFPIRAPLFLRIFGKKTVILMLQNPFLDTAVRAGRIYLKVQQMGVEVDTVTEAIKLREKSAVLVSRIVALIVLRSPLMGWLFGRLLARYLRRNAKEKTLYNISRVIVSSGISDFLNTIRLTSHLRMTKPNLSPMEKRS
ncbi:hypothetical protein [Pedobacter sp. D749]|uniref:hypothetical protein n=1 Tax=Pedobacter sp. D749 TaxID=2856523 RepID=UPI001C5A2571|nr:hypothetical protein [Pedobacter sp. D749]QXU42088.1 hypothetical protein KYH19_00345 [Pedobacter sp. D749]